MGLPMMLIQCTTWSCRTELQPYTFMFLVSMELLFSLLLLLLKLGFSQVHIAYDVDCYCSGFIIF
jgi:hypothetical protein